MCQGSSFSLASVVDLVSSRLSRRREEVVSNLVVSVEFCLESVNRVEFSVNPVNLPFSVSRRAGRVSLLYFEVDSPEASPGAAGVPGSSPAGPPGPRGLEL